MKKIIILTFFISIFFQNYAQNYLSVNVLTLTFHPFAQTENIIHKNKLNQNGKLTFEPGLIISFERQFAKNTYLRISGSALFDRFSTVSGFANFNIKYRFIKYYRHSFSLGVGPAVFYSGLRSNLDGYINEEDYKLTNSMQYKIMWLSGFAQYNYIINKKSEFSAEINLSSPKSFGLSFGLRFKLPEANGKGCNCPSYD